MDGIRVFAIGESSTPLANLLLEGIADEFDLPFLRPFSKWGTWQREHPEIACGLKRGFTFYQHELGRPFSADTALARQLLVGASPEEAVADTHWFRRELDHFFVRQAQALGVDYRDHTALDEATEEANGMRLTGTQEGRPVAFIADFVIDASGPRGFLHRALHLPEKEVEDFPATQALFSHFTGVAPLPDHFCPGTPPYPPEQAAVHHLFDGGWVWVLRFNNGVTSAGVAATDAAAERLRLRDGAAGWKNLLRELPSLAGIFRNARAVEPFVWLPRVAFQSGRVHGRRWVLLPSAAGFVDPLLSTGLALTLLGVQRLGRLLASRSAPDDVSDLEAYASATTLEFETTACLIKALYASLGDFDRFKDLSRLYFAAASFSEGARRLGTPARAPGFLLCQDPKFAPQLRALCESSAVNLSAARARRDRAL